MLVCCSLTTLGSNRCCVNKNCPHYVNFRSMITGAQIRMARGYLNWSVAELAKRAGVGISTVRRMESFDGVPPSIALNIEAVQRTLEAEGVEFIPANGGGPGVRLTE